eukprot:2796045-Pyramimonas_sp.AAC.1
MDFQNESKSPTISPQPTPGHHIVRPGRASSISRWNSSSSSTTKSSARHWPLSAPGYLQLSRMRS